MVLVVGLPLAHEGRLFNTAAVMQSGQAPGRRAQDLPARLQGVLRGALVLLRARRHVRRGAVPGGRRCPFGADLLFALESEPGVTLGVEICEDLWAAVPPSSLHAVAGATVILNPSASNELVAKAEYRRELVKVQSGRTLAAYVYANAGVHESTTDVVFGGQLLVAENGVLLAEGERFKRDGRPARHRRGHRAPAGGARAADLLRRRRARPGPRPPPHRARSPSPRRGRIAWCAAWRSIPSSPTTPPPWTTAASRSSPSRPRAWPGGWSTRGVKRAVLGLSGGLDSTLALLVAVQTFDLLGLPRGGVLAVTMPGFGTTERTLANARCLAQALRVELREIDIRPACEQHIRDIGLDPADRQSVTFQNLQARERTQILMDLANKEERPGGGHRRPLRAGPRLRHLRRRPHRHVQRQRRGPQDAGAQARGLGGGPRDHGQRSAPSCESILDTPVSPGAGGRRAATARRSQRTEDIVGPYELHDFFLYALLRLGAGPRKTLFLAEQAFAGRYDGEAVRRWLRVFVTRFFEQQYKRSLMPDGPKVGSVSLSPRGDWRMPSDASPAAWLAELE